MSMVCHGKLKEEQWSGKNKERNKYVNCSWNFVRVRSSGKHPLEVMSVMGGMCFHTAVTTQEFLPVMSASQFTDYNLNLSNGITMYSLPPGCSSCLQELKHCVKFSANILVQGKPLWKLLKCLVQCVWVGLFHLQIQGCFPAPKLLQSLNLWQGCSRLMSIQQGICR